MVGGVLPVSTALAPQAGAATSYQLNLLAGGPGSGAASRPGASTCGREALGVGFPPDPVLAGSRPEPTTRGGSDAPPPLSL